MLVGPFRAFQEDARAVEAYDSLKLSFVVCSTSGKTKGAIGVYVSHVPSLRDLPLAEVFEHRRCTPTHATLYPLFDVVSAQTALPQCDALDLLVLSHSFSLAEVVIPLIYKK